MCDGHVKAEKQIAKKYTKKYHDIPKYTMHPVHQEPESRVKRQNPEDVASSRRSLVQLAR